MSEIGIKDGKRTVVAEPDWYPRPDGTERAVLYQPGYNSKITSDPRKDYGVHGMEITWFVRGTRGAVQFKIYTEWVPGILSPGHGLPPVGMSFPRRDFDHYPMGADLGYHARVPQYKGQDLMYGDCPIIGGPCYYDGSGMAADELVKEFVVEGEPVIWAKLEERYAGLRVRGGKYDV